MTELSRRKQFTESDCQFLERSGLLTDSYELIEGDIIVTMPQKNRHRLVVMRLIAWLLAHFPQDLVGTQATIRLGASSMPEPDGFVLTDALPADQSYPEPGDVAFVIEVSDTTLAEDLSVKARIYATAQIPEYWVIDSESHRVIVHRQPTSEGYQEVFARLDGASLSPLARPDATISVAQLLPDGEPQL